MQLESPCLRNRSSPKARRSIQRRAFTKKNLRNHPSQRPTPRKSQNSPKKNLCPLRASPEPSKTRRPLRTTPSLTARAEILICRPDTRRLPASVRPAPPSKVKEAPTSLRVMAGTSLQQSAASHPTGTFFSSIPLPVTLGHSTVSFLLRSCETER